jgi:hypothetical protein
MHKHSSDNPSGYSEYVDTTTAQAAMLMALAAITRTRSHQLQQGALSGQQDFLSNRRAACVNAIRKDIFKRLRHAPEFGRQLKANQFQTL